MSRAYLVVQRLQYRGGAIRDTPDNHAAVEPAPNVFAVPRASRSATKPHPQRFQFPDPRTHRPRHRHQLRLTQPPRIHPTRIRDTSASSTYRTLVRSTGNFRAHSPYWSQ